MFWKKSTTEFNVCRWMLMCMYVFASKEITNHALNIGNLFYFFCFFYFFFNNCDIKCCPTPFYLIIAIRQYVWVTFKSLFPTLALYWALTKVIERNISPSTQLCRHKTVLSPLLLSKEICFTFSLCWITT